MRAFVLFAAALLSASHASADSWMAYRDNRAVSPNGKHYLVARMKTFGELSFELCVRRDGVEPLPPVAEPHSWSGKEKEVKVDRDPEDKLVAEGKVDETPMEIRVLDSEPAAILFEQYAQIGYGNTLSRLDSKGKLQWALQLDDFFTEDEIEGFSHTVSSIWWYRGWWVDEKRGTVVVVGSGDLLREVTLKDGKVSTPRPEVVLTRLEEGPLEDRILAFEVASRLLPPGTLPIATRLVKDAAQPIALRLRAVVALRRQGEDPNAEELFLKSIPKGQPEDIRGYAVAHLAEVMGERALPHLRDLMRGPADEAWSSAMRGLESLGEKAVPTLLEMLAEAKESSDYRGGAAHVLGKIQSDKAWEGLLKAVSDKEEYVANAAVNAAIATGGPDLEGRLADILSAGSTQDTRIAGYLEDHPSDKAVRAILAAVERRAADDKDRSRLLNALRKCSGKDFGDSVEAWKTGLGIK